jgi:hypothetical protein
MTQKRYSAIGSVLAVLSLALASTAIVPAATAPVLAATAPAALASAAVANERAAAVQEAESLPSHWIDLSAQPPTLNRLISAAARAAEDVPYWVGYEFELRPGVSVGYGCDDHHSIRFDDGDTIVLPRHRQGDEGVDTSIVGCDRSFGLFLKVEGSQMQDVLRARVITWKRASEIDDPVVWAGLYDADESIHFLRLAILESDGEMAANLSIKVRERLLLAVALHDSAQAPAVAFAALDEREPRDLRESAVMWAATIGGRPAIDRILQLAKHDSDVEVRESSIFWLGQLAGDAATSTLVELAENDPLSDVRRSAVFALSQSEDDAAIEALIKIVRTHDDPEVVRAALFWLGESGDPRALELFEELLVGHA